MIINILPAFTLRLLLNRNRNIYCIFTRCIALLHICNVATTCNCTLLKHISSTSKKKSYFRNEKKRTENWRTAPVYLACNACAMMLEWTALSQCPGCQPLGILNVAWTQKLEGDNTIGSQFPFLFTFKRILSWQITVLYFIILVTRHICNAQTSIICKYKEPWNKAKIRMTQMPEKKRTVKTHML